jgi:hypothetical protein
MMGEFENLPWSGSHPDIESVRQESREGKSRELVRNCCSAWHYSNNLDLPKARFPHLYSSYSLLYLLARNANLVQMENFWKTRRSAIITSASLIFCW